MCACCSWPLYIQVPIHLRLLQHLHETNPQRLSWNYHDLLRKHSISTVTSRTLFLVVFKFSSSAIFLLEFLSSCAVTSFRLQRIHRRTHTMSLTLSFSGTFPDSPSPSKPTCTWMGKATGRSGITCRLTPLQTSTNTRFSGTRISSCQPLLHSSISSQLCFSP